MSKFLLLLVPASLASVVSAQCVQPSSLRTVPHLQGQAYLLAPTQPTSLQGPTHPSWPNIGPGGGPYRGFASFFDLVVNRSLTITQIDYDLSDDGVQNWGPQAGQWGPPGLVGQTAAVNVYTAPTTPPTTWNGTGGLALMVPGSAGAPWTLVATGTLTVMDSMTPSPVVLSTPLALAPGAYAVALEVGPVTTPVAAVGWWSPPYPLHPTANLRHYVPNAAMSASDQFLTISNHASASNAFVSVTVAPFNAPLAGVLELHYAPAPGSAYFSRYGSGCYDKPLAFYEQFGTLGAPAAFDLANSGIRMLPAGASYVVTPTASPIVPPTTPPVTERVNGWPIAAGTNNVDDVVTLPLPLGFAFPFHGGSTTDIVIGSNGFVHLDPTRTIAGAYPGYFAYSLVTGVPILAPFYGDLDPGSGGSVHMEAGPGGEQLITWWNVPHFRFPASPSTVQLAIYPSGMVEYRFGAAGVAYWPVFVGWTPGGNVHVPAALDLSAAMPFQTGDGTIPPVLTMSARPMLGTTPSLVTDDMPNNAAGFLVLGLAALQPGSSLAFLGMPGCLQEVAPATATFFAATGTSGAVPLGPIPNLPGFMGYSLFGQSAVLSPGSNGAGITVSNGLCITAGL